MSNQGNKPPDKHHQRAAPRGGIIPGCTASSLCSTSKEPHPHAHKEHEDGVSTYLALTFGTLLSSQGTEATFTAVSPAPPGFPFAVFPTLAEAFPSELPLALRGHGCPARDF